MEEETNMVNRKTTLRRYILVAFVIFASLLFGWWHFSRKTDSEFHLPGEQPLQPLDNDVQQQAQKQDDQRKLKQEVQQEAQQEVQHETQQEVQPNEQHKLEQEVQQKLEQEAQEKSEQKVQLNVQNRLEQKAQNEIAQEIQQKLEIKLQQVQQQVQQQEQQKLKPEVQQKSVSTQKAQIEKQPLVDAPTAKSKSKDSSDSIVAEYLQSKVSKWTNANGQNLGNNQAQANTTYNKPASSTLQRVGSLTSNNAHSSNQPSHRLDISAAEWMPEISSVNVTAVFAKDLLFKQVQDFTIDPLIDFFPHEVLRHNSDNTTYENWLSMTFPPDASWDQDYKTPCYVDYESARLRCLPHIYMVGWAKSGTTDMWWYLNRHPQLVHGYKETQFLTQFSFWDNHKDMKTFSTLLEFFDHRVDEEQKNHTDRLMYDATATIIYDNWHWRIKQGYAGDPHVPTHTNFHYLRKIHPSAQIVVMMRNPVTRALSFYNHGVDMSVNNNANLGFKYVNMPKSNLDIHKFFVDSIRYFNECVEKTSLRACCHMSGWNSQHWGDPKYFMTLRIGIYYIFLEEVYKNYPPSQVHLIKSETFYDNPATTLYQLFSFLDISTEGVHSDVEIKGSNILMKLPKYFQPLTETYQLLQKFYAPFNKRLAAMLNDQKWLEWEREMEKYTHQIV